MRLTLEPQSLDSVPEQPGIFFLWDNSHPVYIGRTAPRSNLRAELRHALTMAMAEDLAVTHFTFEVTTTPKTRATEELRAYFAQWGSLPRYNERASARSLQKPEEPHSARR